MQYEIRAYDALYDTKTRRIAYWDVCSDEQHKYRRYKGGAL